MIQTSCLGSGLTQFEQKGSIQQIADNKDQLSNNRARAASLGSGVSEEHSRSSINLTEELSQETSSARRLNELTNQAFRAQKQDGGSERDTVRGVRNHGSQWQGCGRDQSQIVQEIPQVQLVQQGCRHALGLERGRGL